MHTMKHYLTKYESLFNTDDINDALVAFITKLETNEKLLLGEIEIMLQAVLTYFSHGTDLLNEIDDSIYYWFEQKGMGNFYLPVLAGPKRVINTKMTVAWLIYNYKDLETLILPRVVKATPLSPKNFTLLNNSDNHISNVKLPGLMLFDKSYTLFDTSTGDANLIVSRDLLIQLHKKGLDKTQV